MEVKPDGMNWEDFEACRAQHRKDQIEGERRKLWCDVWVGVARDPNVNDFGTPADWADVAVEAFDKRFRR